MRIPVAAVVVALAVPACQPDRDQPEAPPSEAARVDDGEDPFPSETWDSAGIRIVENARPQDGSRLPWMIGPDPSVSIGDVDGEDPYLFRHAWDATKLADGRIVVADRSTSELRVFDSVGTHVATWGGRGMGPGEFPASSLGDVDPWAGDSIIAWYSDAQTVSVFDSEGNFGRSFLRPGAGKRSWEVAWPRLTRRDGTIVAILSEVENSGTTEVHILDGEGALHRSLGPHPSRLALYFSRQLKLGLWGDLVVVGTTHRYELKAFDSDGTLVRIVRREHVPRVPRPEDIMVSPTLREELRAALEADLKNVRQSELAEFFPAFADIMSDEAGYLWVREFEPPKEAGPAPVWTVFDPDGRVLGFVQTPPGLEIYEIGEDYLLGRAMGDMDVEMVQVWPLVR